MLISVKSRANAPEVELEIEKGRQLFQTGNVHTAHSVPVNSVPVSSVPGLFGAGQFGAEKC